MEPAKPIDIAELPPVEEGPYREAADEGHAGLAEDNAVDRARGFVEHSIETVQTKVGQVGELVKTAVGGVGAVAVGAAAVLGIEKAEDKLSHYLGTSNEVAAILMLLSAGLVAFGGYRMLVKKK
jgi:hypothetical protein